MRIALFALIVSLPAAAAPTAAQTFASLEAQLLEARTVRVNSTISASGALAVNLNGRSEISVGGQAALVHTGTFAGRGMTLELRSDGRQITLARDDETVQVASGRESNRALLIGLMRMGLLHNLAQLSSLKGPDHAEGGVSEWVTVRNLRYLSAKNAEKYGPSPVALAFNVNVGGAPAATAVLWLDEDTRLPLKREQTVKFPGGSMTVIETYSGFVIE